MRGQIIEKSKGVWLVRIESKRENILIDVTRRVFSYTAAADAAENEFIKNGFRAFAGGKWKPEN